MMHFEGKIDTPEAIGDSYQGMALIANSTQPQLGSGRKVMFSDEEGRNIMDGIPSIPSTSIAASIAAAAGYPKQAEFSSSQPTQATTAYDRTASNGESIDVAENQHINMDWRFNSFKTLSGKLQRQLSVLSRKRIEPEPEPDDVVLQMSEVEALPVKRYFDALEGPELEIIRDSEKLVLPEDKKWPFLLRFPITSFAVCLGVGSQAVVWRDLSTKKSMSFLHISLTVNLVIWSIFLALAVIVSSIYSLKVIFYFEAVRREFQHPIRVNFFFTPWITALLLAVCLPPAVATYIHPVIWYILMIPIILLDIKIFGQWMMGSNRRLSMVANPANHIGIVGNFLGSFLGAYMGLKDGPLLFFAVGLAHYIVLFVTLYQKLPTNQTLPKELHPVFFLFVAAPSIASITWAMIQGAFDYVARIFFFIALFLYITLAVRINFFRGFRFSLTWWAYTLPMTGMAIASVAYSDQVTNLFTQILAVVLSSISAFAVIAILITTIYHAFVLQDLFPNDKAIAISKKSPEVDKKQFHLPTGSSDNGGIEASMEAQSPDDKSESPCVYIDIGTSTDSTSS